MSPLARLVLALDIEPQGDYLEGMEIKTNAISITLTWGGAFRRIWTAVSGPTTRAHFLRDLADPEFAVLAWAAAQPLPRQKGCTLECVIDRLDAIELEDVSPEPLAPIAIETVEYVERRPSGVPHSAFCPVCGLRDGHLGHKPGCYRLDLRDMLPTDRVRA